MPVIEHIVAQYAEEASFLWSQRDQLTQARITLRDLRRTDDRLAAQLDGLAIAGEQGWRFCEAALETADSGAVFTSAVRAIEDRREDRLSPLIAQSKGSPKLARGLHAAFGWVSGASLQGIVSHLLTSEDPFICRVAIAACAMHRVDALSARPQCFTEADPNLVARALRSIGELGSEAAKPVCLRALGHEDPACRFWAAWSAVRLGGRGKDLESLQATSLIPGPFRKSALRMALQALAPAAAHSFLQQVAASPQSQRLLIWGSGIAGEPAYIPWLIQQMSDPKTARLAGESFSAITGHTLEGLDRDPPKDFDAGPSDDAEDSNVQADPDDGLVWPDPDRVNAWWRANGNRFQPGVRTFVGDAVTRDRCIKVLKEGHQRERMSAAFYLALAVPSSPLFDWRAPAWRQQKLLADMH